MTARTASLRVAHSSKCANANQTSLDSLRSCTCQPSYYTLYRGRDGRPVKGARVKDRRVANRALDKIKGEIAEGRVGLAKPKTITFSEWIPRWEAELETQGKRASTIRVYLRSARAAAAVFGAYDLREVGNDELRRFVVALRENGNRDVTVGKHLRHLSACFQAALAYDYLDANPIGRYRRSIKLSIQPSDANYFSDGELQRLWAQLRDGLPSKNRPDETRPVAPVFLYLMRFAVVTGARIGEIVALKWGDLRLTEGAHGTLRITKAWNDVDGETLPKTRKSVRTLHLTEDGRRVVDEWAAFVGEVLPDDALLFPNSRGNHISPTDLNRHVLNPAMAAAGIPKVGDDSPEPRSFHTLRHCFARIMLERGQPLQWVANELGHESTGTTEKVYGHWAKKARQAQAAAVPAGAFPV